MTPARQKKAAANNGLVTPKKKQGVKNVGGRPEEYSLEFLEGELRRVNGKVYIAAKAIGCSSKVLYDYINRHPHLKEVVDDARSIIVDKAELALESAITSKQGWAVCFTLKTLGKERGYVERSEVTGKDGAPLLDSARWLEAAERIAKKHRKPLDEVKDALIAQKPELATLLIQ